MTSPSVLAPVPVVFDTNVVLDLLVYDDAFVRPLGAALAAGTLLAWADVHTLRELELVLAYPGFRLEAAAQAAALARYRGMVRLAPEDTDVPLPALPRCKDRDDQKFLALAARVGARWLVSKDKLVLALAGRHDLPFTILTPRKAAGLLPG